MKILHLLPTLSAGGAETFAAELAITQRAMGHEVEVFLLAGARGARGKALNAGLAAASVPCFGAATRSPRDPRNVLRLFRQLMIGRYDVVHAHLYSVELVLASLIPLLSIAGIKPLYVRTLHNSNIYGTRSRRLTRMLSGVFDWNFACGRNVLDNYVDLFGASRASAIENGVLTADVVEEEPRHCIRQELGLCENTFVVSCIGAFRGPSLAKSQKAQDIAIRAFCLAFERDSSARLLLVGDGELRSEAEILVRKLGNDSNIHFLGNLPDVQNVLRISDVLFMPSRYEGLPIVGLEAGCAGLPVLASSINELAEVGSPYGWMFSKDNSAADFARWLVKIRKDPSAAHQQARRMSGPFRERFGIGRCAQRYLEKLQGLLDLRNKSAD